MVHHRTYCVDPLRKHKTKIYKYIRKVSGDVFVQNENEIIKVNKDSYLCLNCMKKIQNLGALPKEIEGQENVSSELNINLSEDNSSEKGSSSSSFEDEKKADINMQKLLPLLAQTPIKKKGLKTSQKKRKVEQKLKLGNQQLKKNLESTYGVKIKETSSSKQNVGKIMQELKASFNECDNYKRKIQILTLSPYTVKHTAKFFETSIYMVKRSRSIKREYGIMPEVPSMSKGKVITNKDKLLVKEFYESDEVSRMCPGQKDCLTVRNSEGQSCKVQKRLILGNLKELYELYKNNGTNSKVGFSTFAKLRPPYCVLAGAGGTHCVCVCTYHQNPKLQLAALGEKGLTYKDLMDYSVCNSEREECMMMTCKDCPREEGVQAFLELLDSVQSASEEITYKQWVTTDRCTMITEVKILHEFLTSLSRTCANLVRHHFVAQKQAHYFKDLKDNLPFHSEAVVVGDFSENYSFLVQDAAQGFHYENSQCTVHPFIVYFKSNGSPKLCHKSFCFLSDSTKHNTVMVHTFISKLIPYLKVTLPNLKKIHYFSDGCVGQYKNKYNFKNLCYHNEDYGLTCEWNFFATSHGKSACDGIGGTIKRATARASLQRTTSRQILTPEDMFRFCEESLSSNIKYFFVSKRELEESNRKLKHRFADLCTIPGTRQFHRFVPKNTEELMVYLFSSSSKGELKRIIHTPGDTVHAAKVTDVKVGQYVGCVYDKKIWFGIVEEYNEEFDDFFVNFLEPSATFGIGSYNFPTRKDTCSVPGDSILAIMSPPSLKGGTRLQYIFQEEEVSKCFKSANLLSSNTNV